MEFKEAEILFAPSDSTLIYHLSIEDISIYKCTTSLAIKTDTLDNSEIHPRLFYE